METALNILAVAIQIIGFAGIGYGLYLCLQSDLERDKPRRRVNKPAGSNTLHAA